MPFADMFAEIFAVCLKLTRQQAPPTARPVQVIGSAWLPLLIPLVCD